MVAEESICGAFTKATKNCPLCASSRLKVVEHVRVADIEHEYKRQMGISVRGEFPAELDVVTLMRCADCLLGFYFPLVTGSDRFYASLASNQGYYVRDRWEFDQAVNHLSANPDLVDVGCGDGEFLMKVRGNLKRGLEFNPEAVHRARARGLSVERKWLAELPEESADTISMFQVLEHVADPGGLVRDAVRVLRPSGRLIIGVPNDDACFAAAIHDPLNAPPHHVLRWRRDTLAKLPEFAPIRLESIFDEPVCGGRSLYLYRRGQFSRFLASAVGGRLPVHRVCIAMTVARRAANLWALASGWVRPVPSASAIGPSMLAIFEKS